ncbi:hypothetical protein [Clavibacter nebraskensis]|uniref:Uncharacterized protein n=1 Tax=Clavibacter nebraskensis TaxID=31963 RepID=A0ABY4MTX4_9MICO|nr:hypothetical protein [Clavibacter nebraskensis]QGV66629.2 hypothetical protein EGX36_07225 [Clavibacter nebraskensis]QGV69427.2 hypothetical protein EGX37_07215 [Clavibacter nebraskensis]QGV72217.2 hypothetical protein EGX35_07215 [Clavibacter nebraskensis]UQB06299.1 hypothetical protein LIV34_001447 [Clavibacter nebraskensis]UQB09122.1 hypothetical protein LIX21_001447 [Clavibacter nebraskensis]
MLRATALPVRPRRTRRPSRPGGRRRFLPAVLALALVLGLGVAGPSVTEPAAAADAPAATASASVHGYATHYSLGPGGGTTNGNCSLPAIP